MDDNERLARMMHELYERAAVKAGWKTQKSCRTKPWEELPPANQKTMLQVANGLLERLSWKKAWETR